MQLGSGQILEAIPDVVVVVDVSGSIVVANSAAERVSGFSKAELSVLPVGRLLVDEGAGMRTEVRERVADGEVLRREDAWLVTKSGQRIPVSMTAAPVVDPDGTTRGIVLVARDMRELRRLIEQREAEIARREQAEVELRRVMATIEERLDQARSQLVLAERRATLGTLAAGVGHELRNIAQVLTTAVELIEERSPRDLDTEVREAQADLARVAEHITTHARRLMNLAKPGPEHASALDIGRAARDVVAMLEGAGKLRGITTTLAAPETPVLVTVNKTRIEQILVNLLLNAAEALGKSHRTIMVAIHVRALPGRVIVEVSDSGPGIPAEVLPKIFEPFFTTKGEAAGTGLGLPVAREIVRSYGGELTASSTPGIGATFRFDLPMSSAR